MGSRSAKFFRNTFPVLYALTVGAKKLLCRKRAYLRQVGWVRSLLEAAPVSSSGEPLPWMNYGVVALLEERLHDGLVLFEYGSGYSTRFFAQRVKRVISVEYNPEWYEFARKGAASNIEIIFKGKDLDGEYCRAIEGVEGLVDVVVVDGRDRVNCVIQAIQKLNPAGVVILDDSDRERYVAAFDHMRRAGFRVLSFRGLKPGSGRAHQTSIFYRDGNCLGL